MKLKIEEYKFKISHLNRTRTDTLTYKAIVDVCPGFVDFVGIREKQIYESFLHVDKILDDEIVLSVYKNNKILGKTYNIRLYDEDFYQVKGPMGKPVGYWYRFVLMDDKESE